MVFVAMFLENHAWIQVLVFVLCSLFMCLFVGYSYPFIKSTTNALELFNEIMIMFVGILSMAYVGRFAKTLPERVQVGEFMRWVIIIQIILNLIFIVYKLAWNGKLKIKYWIAYVKYMKRKKKVVKKLEESLKNKFVDNFSEGISVRSPSGGSNSSPPVRQPLVEDIEEIEEMADEEDS